MSLVSCDNMADNGAVLRRLVREFIAATAWEDRDRLLDWITGSVAFPATVVDRIVPATTDADRRAAARALTVADAGAVTGEPFTQWVLQDIFAADRPRWEAAGVRFVPDVSPYQLAKLRLLNGAHSLIAYLGLAAGCETVADVLATPWGEETVRAYCAEAAQSLPPTEGLDLPAYIDSLVDRFANPAMEHRVQQIAMDGSQKIPERWLAPLRELRAAGRDTPSWPRPSPPGPAAPGTTPWTIRAPRSCAAPGTARTPRPRAGCCGCWAPRTSRTTPPSSRPYGRSWTPAPGRRADRTHRPRKGEPP